MNIEKLIEARKAERYTQHQLSNKLGKHTCWVQRYESKQTKLFFDDAVKLCELLKIDIKDLI